MLRLQGLRAALPRRVWRDVAVSTPACGSAGFAATVRRMSVMSGLVAGQPLRQARGPGRPAAAWRALQLQQVRFHGHGEDHVEPDAKSVVIIFRKMKDGSEQKVEGKVGQNLLRLAQHNGVELEGACECSLACSTCHVIFEDGDVFEELGEPCEDEEDMLDQAFGLSETSRLGCQILLTESMDGTTVTLPAATRNFYVDGHVPEPH